MTTAISQSDTMHSRQAEPGSALTFMSPNQEQSLFLWWRHPMILIETQIICFVTLFKVPLLWTSKESVLNNMSGGSWFFFQKGEDLFCQICFDRGLWFSRSHSTSPWKDKQDYLTQIQSLTTIYYKKVNIP